MVVLYWIIGIIIGLLLYGIIGQLFTEIMERYSGETDLYMVGILWPVILPLRVILMFANIGAKFVKWLINKF